MKQIRDLFSCWAKCSEIWSEKVPDLFNLVYNLTHFGAKPTIPGAKPDILHVLITSTIPFPVNALYVFIG